MRVKKTMAGAVLGCALSLIATAGAEDIDLFATPMTAAQRPNVLVILDNSSNWGSDFSEIKANCGSLKSEEDREKKFCHEIQALNTILSNPAIINNINLGLMMFSPSGENGGYVRFGIRPMDVAANRTAFTNMLNNLVRTADDSAANQPYGKAMFEAFKYFGGYTSPANANLDVAGTPAGPTGFGPALFAGMQSFRDAAGNSLTPADSMTEINSRNQAMNAVYALAGNALTSMDSTSYSNPIASLCAKTYVIFISNGNPGTGGDSGSTSADTLLSNVGGTTTRINPPDHASLADEYARFLYQTDASALPGKQNVITYGVGVWKPQSNGTASLSDQKMIDLMKSMVKQGGGDYCDGNDPTNLAKCMEKFFLDIQAVNSVFTSASLPINVNVQGTFLNQVFMGVFRPDGDSKPRWFGNLKQYQFAYDSTLDTLFLADKNGVAIASNTTGFINPTASSIWSTAENYLASPNRGFWFNRQLGAGTQWDAPDGEIVEKGGVAQRLRSTYKISQTGRTLYTSTGGTALTAFTAATVATSMLGLAATETTERDNIVNWVRGTDNKGDELRPGGTVTVRPSMHGDVLHSRPAVVNYGGSTGVVVFYGANDGIFRAVRGGTTDTDGVEMWGFIAPEHLGQLKRLRDNSPLVKYPGQPAVTPVAEPKPYFMDGPIGVYLNDENGNGIIDGNDKVYLYVGARRGGRFIYALNVTNPASPVILWKKGCFPACDTGYGELGQTWSEPRAVKVRGSANPVLIFGAGYSTSEDAEPPTAASMGRGVLVVDAFTGNALWQAGPSPSGATTNSSVAGMTSPIAADLRVLDRNADGFADRVYAADLGGNIWRLDINDANPANWTVMKLASLGSASSVPRKFFYPPSVVTGRTFDAVLIGSGDREHPLRASASYDAVNRFYMVKDTATGFTNSGLLPLTEIDLIDMTAAGNTLPPTSKGWYLTLLSGEKVVNAPVTAAGVVYFGTNQAVAVDANSCSNLGIARSYSLSYRDAIAPLGGNLYLAFPGGGLPPTPVVGVVVINGVGHNFIIGAKTDTTTKGGGGTSADAIKSSPPSSRGRVYWYKK